MKYIIYISLFFCFTGVNGQTKKDTEEWVEYYLNRYFANTKSANTVGDLTTTFLKEGNFYFSKKELVYYYKSWFEIFPSREVDTIVSPRDEIIDLSQIRKVDYSISEDSVNGFTCVLSFKFIEKNAPPTNVKIWDIKTNKYIDNNTNSYTIESTNIEVLRDSIPTRLIKAFNHLILLNRGAVMKNVF
jgi:hypothetical protein